MKKQNGITLIALIITIIVMLILVGVTINVAINGGLLTTAQRAATEMSKAQIQERAEIVKITLMADLQSGNDSIMGLKKEYMNRLKTEFRVTDNEVKIDKVIVEDGKYDIIVKNSDLDIEVREHSDYVDKSSIVSIMSSNANDIIIYNKIYGRNVQIDLSLNIDREKYVLQEFEKNPENKVRPTDEQKEQAILDFMSQELSDIKGTEIRIQSIDEYFVEQFELIASSNGSTHNNEDIDDWLKDENLPEMLGLPEETVITKSTLYNMVLGNQDITLEMTEDQFIQHKYAAEYEYEEREAYRTEYNKNTQNLKLYVMYNGQREDIAEKIDLIDTIQTQEYITNKNGEYLFILENSEEEIVSSETLVINDIETNNPYVLTKKEAEGIWKISGEQLVEYSGSEEKLIVPVYIGNTKIKWFGRPGVDFDFTERLKIKEIILPEGIEFIGYMAFFGSKNLQSISLPNTLISIKDLAFHGCESISAITIPKSVTSISKNSFENCPNLTNIYLEEGSPLISSIDAPWGAPSATVTVLPAEE